MSASAPAVNHPRILLVEDNAFNADMLTRRLMRAGFGVVLAEDGALAIERAHTEHPDSILMDVSLPNMDGLEATRRLKADPETNGIPVIALTAHAMLADRQAALDAGCQEFETKPVEFARLVGKIKRFLDTGVHA
ncbi:MAG: response regulator [Vicinamibacterales bacterium]